MTDKEKLDAIRAEIHRLVDVRGYDRGMANDLFAFMDSLPNEPVSNTTFLYGLSGSVEIEEAVKETEEYKEWQGDPERQQSFIDFAKFGANYKQKTSEDLEEAAEEWDESLYRSDAFIAGALWQKEQIIKNAISMDVYYETEWDDIHKFLRKNLDGEKVKLLIIKEE